jgi:hypothetical protein
MNDAIRSIIKFVILVIILFAALAILVSPQFAQAIAIIVILLTIAGLVEGLSKK